MQLRGTIRDIRLQWPDRPLMPPVPPLQGGAREQGAAGCPTQPAAEKQRDCDGEGGYSRERLAGGDITLVFPA